MCSVLVNKGLSLYKLRAFLPNTIYLEWSDQLIRQNWIWNYVAENIRDLI
jgi:hypothetical protein